MRRTRIYAGFSRRFLAKPVFRKRSATGCRAMRSGRQLPPLRPLELLDRKALASPNGMSSLASCSPGSAIPSQLEIRPIIGAQPALLYFIARPARTEPRQNRKAGVRNGEELSLPTAERLLASQANQRCQRIRRCHGVNCSGHAALSPACSTDRVGRGSLGPRRWLSAFFYVPRADEETS